jgi:hypothetical protein
VLAECAALGTDLSRVMAVLVIHDRAKIDVACCVRRRGRAGADADIGSPPAGAVGRRQAWRGSG